MQPREHGSIDQPREQGGHPLIPERTFAGHHPRRARLWIAALLAFAAPASAIAPAPRIALATPEAGIQRLLDERARAVMGRDQAAFMRTLDPDSRAFRRRQRRAFRWMAPLDIASYRLLLDRSRYGDLTTGAIRRRYPGAQDVVVALVRERYALTGYDDRPAEEELFFTFVKRAGRWSIAGDSALDPVGIRSKRHLWDTAPLVQRRSEHFMLLHHPCRRGRACVDLPDDLLELAEAALGRVEEMWGLPWRKSVVILVPDTQRELQRMLQSTFDLEDFVAFAYSTTDGSFRHTGYRVILNWNNIAGRDPASITSILAHELLHIATRNATGPFVPAFVDEGVAEYVGRGADPAALGFLRSQIAAGNFDRRLPLDHEFVTGDGTDIFTSYQESFSAMLYLAERFGARKLQRLYADMGAARTAPGVATYRVNEAFERVTGLGYPAFERAWASSIARR